jgi:hypothetical protein
LVTDGVYTRGRVAYLLSLDHEDAVSLSVSWLDSVGSATMDGHHAATAHDEFDPVLLVAEWHDVQRARGRVIARRRDARALSRELVITQLRGEGVSEREIAEALHMDDATARRRYRSFLDEVLDELGGEAFVEGPESQPSACLRCGRAPRVRTSAKRKITELGRRRTRTITTLTSLCRGCLETARGGPVEHTPMVERSAA